jgi:hypothetical protein
MSKSKQRAGAVVAENRVAPPQLEAVAGWDQTDEAAYHAAASGEGMAADGTESTDQAEKNEQKETKVTKEVPAGDTRSQEAGGRGQESGGRGQEAGVRGQENASPLTPQASPLTACMCQSVLGNLGPVNGGYHARHVDVGGLSAVEQEVLARLRAGLIANHATIRKAGERTKHVESSADTVRWLLQQLAGLSIATAGS